MESKDGEPNPVESQAEEISLHPPIDLPILCSFAFSQQRTEIAKEIPLHNSHGIYLIDIVNKVIKPEDEHSKDLAIILLNHLFSRWELAPMELIEAEAIESLRRRSIPYRRSERGDLLFPQAITVAEKFQQNTGLQKVTIYHSENISGYSKVLRVLRILGRQQGLKRERIEHLLAKSAVDHELTTEKALAAAVQHRVCQGNGSGLYTLTELGNEIYTNVITPHEEFLRNAIAHKKM